MKIAAICATYKRPEQLANAIACFQYQDYANKELIVIDDVGQYPPVNLPGVKFISFPHRFRTLGEKRNATVALSSFDADAFCVWDDDDAYMPWHISECAKALDTSEFVIPRKLYIEKRNRLQLIENKHRLFHGAWCFTRRLFNLIGGYPAEQSGQDQSLKSRAVKSGVTFSDTGRASYVYRWQTAGVVHLSACSSHSQKEQRYREVFGQLPADSVQSFTPQLSKNWPKILIDNRLSLG